MNVFFGILIFLLTGIPVSPDVGFTTFYETTPILYGSFLWLHISLGVLSLFLILNSCFYQKLSSDLTLLETSLCFATGLLFQTLCQYFGFYNSIHFC